MHIHLLRYYVLDKCTVSVPHILAINHNGYAPHHLFDISIEPADSPLLPADLEALQLTTRLYLHSMMFQQCRKILFENKKYAYFLG